MEGMGHFFKSLLHVFLGVIFFIWLIVLSIDYSLENNKYEINDKVHFCNTNFDEDEKTYSTVCTNGTIKEIHQNTITLTIGNATKEVSKRLIRKGKIKTHG